MWEAILGNLGLAAQVAGSLGSAYASYRGSEGTKAGYEYQSQVARSNQKLADWQAQDALERGVKTKQTLQLRKAKLYGSQEAILASRNVALDEGSALNLLTDTKFLGARDEDTATDNANKEAWALRNQAAGYAANADFLKYRADMESPLLNAGGTALTALGRVSQSWYATRARSSGRSSPTSAYLDE